MEEGKRERGCINVNIIWPRGAHTASLRPKGKQTVLKMKPECEQTGKEKLR